MTRRCGFAATMTALAFAAAALVLKPADAFADSEGIRVLYSLEGGNRSAWNDSLAAALARSELLDAILPAPEGMEPLEAAARLSCALAVRVLTRLPADADAVSDWSILDPLTGETLFSGRVEGPSPTDRELSEYWWIPVVSAAEAALPRVKQTLVRIEGLPGTVIEGFGDKSIVLPEEGFLEIPLRVPGTYPWRAVASGAYPERGYFGALEQGQTLSIPHNPLRLWSVESAFFMMEFPDFWVSRRFREDSLFVRFGFMQYLFGVYLGNGDSEDADPSIFLSLPLLMPGVGFGGYFLPSDVLVRPYAAATVFTRILLIDGYWGFDPIAPLGVLTVGGIEWRAFERSSVFLELGATVYPFCDSLLHFSTFTGDGPFWILYGLNWLVELPLLRFGARFSL